MKKMLILLGALILFGCTGSQSESNIPKDWENMSDWNWFSIYSPSSFREHIIRPDGSVALTTYNTITTDRESNDYSVHLHSSLRQSCSPSLTGASETTPLSNANGKAEWGKSDLQELSKQEGYIPPYNTDNVKCGGSPSVYAFCAEKDGKTVVICVNQITDNPALAKEIFETFRWTK